MAMLMMALMVVITTPHRCYVARCAIGSRRKFDRVPFRGQIAAASLEFVVFRWRMVVMILPRGLYVRLLRLLIRRLRCPSIRDIYI